MSAFGGVVSNKKNMQFSLPSNFIASTTAIMSDVITGLGSYITLIVGVILAVVVIEIIINALRPK